MPTPAPPTNAHPPALHEPKMGSAPAAGQRAAPPTLNDGQRHLTRGYVWSGCAAGVLATMPTSLAEIAIIPPAIFFLIGAHRTWRLWLRTLLRPAFLCLLTFYAWLAIGLLWSPSRSLGVEEVGTSRFFAVALLLTPALRLTTTGRRHLIIAVCVGFLIGHLVQAGNAWALHAGGPEALRFGRNPNRMSGWWDPAVAGTILTAALGLHLPAALMGRGRPRLLALGAVGVTLTGLAMTGSRGGWIASALLLAAVSLFAVARAFRLGVGRGAVLATLAGLLVAVAAVGFLLRGPITERVDQARGQVAAALDGEVTGDTGARVAMKQEALAAFAAHPIAGVGTGGFSAWTTDRRGEGDKVASFDHAHDTLLHTAASNGVIGVGLLLAAFGLAARDAARLARERGIGTYAAGPLIALLGLALTTPFDTLHVSNTAAAVTGFVFTLCLAPPRSSTHKPIDIAAGDRARAC